MKKKVIQQRIREGDQDITQNKTTKEILERLLEEVK